MDARTGRSNFEFQRLPSEGMKILDYTGALFIPSCWHALAGRRASLERKVQVRQACIQ